MRAYSWDPVENPGEPRAGSLSLAQSAEAVHSLEFSGPGLSLVGLGFA